MSIVVLGGGLAVAAHGALAAFGPAAKARWTVQPTPNPPGSTSAGLSAVACASAAQCVAVGASSGTGGTSPLAERWNGTRWAIMAIPDPSKGNGASLAAIACPSQRECVAVGSYPHVDADTIAFAEIWNGKKWSLESTPMPPGSQGSDLDGLACSSTDACTAVGAYDTVVHHLSTEGTLAEEWNGSTWRLERTPNPTTTASGWSALVSVACTSGTTCTAIGTGSSDFSNLPFAEGWDGSSWRIESTPDPSGRFQFTSIDCAATGSCIAVGENGGRGTLAEQWNGRTWTVRSMPALPAPGELNGVDCSAAVSCVAVGTEGSSTLAEAWNGRSWTIEPTPNPDVAPTGTTIPPVSTGTIAPSNENTLSAVACPSASSCVAVGGDIDSMSVGATLVERSGR